MNLGAGSGRFKSLSLHQSCTWVSNINRLCEPVWNASALYCLLCRTRQTGQHFTHLRSTRFLSLLVWGSLVGGYSLVATQSITLPMSNIPISITLSELSLHKGTPLARAIPPYCDIHIQALTQIRVLAWRPYRSDVPTAEHNVDSYYWQRYRVSKWDNN